MRGVPRWIVWVGAIVLAIVLLGLIWLFLQSVRGEGGAAGVMAWTLRRLS
jgi:hypothetical protein